MQGVAKLFPLDIFGGGHENYQKMGEYANYDNVLASGLWQVQLASCSTSEETFCS